MTRTVRVQAPFFLRTRVVEVIRQTAFDDVEIRTDTFCFDVFLSPAHFSKLVKVADGRALDIAKEHLFVTTARTVVGMVEVVVVSGETEVNS